MRSGRFRRGTARALLFASERDCNPLAWQLLLRNIWRSDTIRAFRSAGARRDARRPSVPVVPPVRPFLLRCVPLASVAVLAGAASARAQGAPVVPISSAPAGAPAAIPAMARVAAGGAAIRGLEAGDTVRLESAAGRYAGRVARITDDTLVISSRGRTDAVLRAEITRLDRLAGRGSRGKAMLRGGGIGLASGAALGLLAGASVGRVHCDATNPGCAPGRDEKIGVALGADGALIGALLGMMAGPSFRGATWERIDAAPAHIPAAPAVGVSAAPGGGVAVGARLKI